MTLHATIEPLIYRGDDIMTLVFYSNTVLTGSGTYLFFFIFSFVYLLIADFTSTAKGILCIWTPEGELKYAASVVLCHIHYL